MEPVLALIRLWVMSFRLWKFLPRKLENVERRSVKQPPFKSMRTMARVSHQCLRSLISCHSTNSCHLSIYIVVTLEKGLEIKIEDDKTRAHEQAAAMVKECKAQFAEKKGDPYRLLEELSECLENSVNASLAEKDEDKSFHATVRERLGEKLEQYQCLDGKAEQTKSIENRTWTFENKQHPIKVFIDRPSAKIMLVEDFISPAECQAAEGRITTERVNANGLSAKKGSMLFPAKQADSLYKLGKRIYSFAEEELKVGLEEKENREDLFLLHYEANAENPDHYAPHCDGKCDGGQAEKGDRIATFIMYCVVPEVGGATHFSRTGSHIPGTPGDALFYVYVDPKSGISDTGMTNHSGCPVIEGEKKILTHKIRLG